MTCASRPPSMPSGSALAAVRARRDVVDQRALLRVALDVPAALLPGEVLGPRLEHRGRDQPRLVAHLARDDRDRRAGHRRRAAAVGAEPVRRLVGVAVADLDVLGRDAELLGDDLRERRLVALALGLRAEADTTALPDGCTRRSAPSFIDSPRMSMCLRGPAPTPSVKNDDADAHQLAAGALLGLLAAQVVVAGDVHRDLHRLGVVAGVVGPAGGRLVRELLRAR